MRLLLLLFGVQSVRLVPLGLLLRPLLIIILARLLFVVGGVAQLRPDVVAKLNSGASSTAAEAEAERQRQSVSACKWAAVAAVRSQRVSQLTSS